MKYVIWESLWVKDWCWFSRIARVPPTRLNRCRNLSVSVNMGTNLVEAYAFDFLVIHCTKQYLGPALPSTPTSSVSSHH